MDIAVPRKLVMPSLMVCLFVCLFQNAYIEYKEIKAAQGVKIAGKDLEKAIAGKFQLILSPKDIFTYLPKRQTQKNIAFLYCFFKFRDVRYDLSWRRSFCRNRKQMALVQPVL